jgi:hypothetical protein
MWVDVCKRGRAWPRFWVCSVTERLGHVDTLKYKHDVVNKQSTTAALPCRFVLDVLTKRNSNWAGSL